MFVDRLRHVGQRFNGITGAVERPLFVRVAGLEVGDHPVRELDHVLTAAGLQRLDDSRELLSLLVAGVFNGDFDGRRLRASSAANALPAAASRLTTANAKSFRMGVGTSLADPSWAHNPTPGVSP